jgi:hypothetical protein
LRCKVRCRIGVSHSHVGRCSSAQDRGDAGFQILTRRRPRSPGNPQKRGIDFRTGPHDMCAVGLERVARPPPRHFAQALHFARSPGRGLLAKCHPRPDIRKQVSRAFDNRPVSCRAAKRCLTPFQGDEICLAPINPALPWTTFRLEHVGGNDSDSSMGLSQSLTCSKTHWKCSVLHIDVIPSTISENASPFLAPRRI